MIRLKFIHSSLNIYLENIAAYNRDHDVNVVDEEKGLVDDGVGDVGEVVRQVEHHGQGVARGVVELLQQVHQNGTSLRLGAEERRVQVFFCKKNC